MVNNQIKSKLSNNELKAAFAGTFTPPTVSLKSLWQVYIATAIVALPLVIYSLTLLYFGIKLLIFALFEMPPFVEGAGGLYAAGYTAVVVLGSSLLFFCVRPFFRSVKRKTNIDVRKPKEPALYALVNTIARFLNAPKVAHIQLNSEVVVEAYYRNYHDAKQNELTLVLGIPVLSCLSTNQIASLIAHELGHYTHPKLRQCFATLRLVRAWMFQVINSEEGWEEKIDKWKDRLPSDSLHVMFLPVEGGIAMVNSIFQFFYDATGNLSQQAVHEMERLADMHQAAMVGSNGFSTMLHALIKTDQSYHAATEKIHLGEIFPDDLGRLVRNIFDKSPEQKDQYIELAATETFTSWYMHPAPASRNNSIKKQKLKALFNLPRPIDEIFINFSGYSKALTNTFYNIHGIDIEKIKLEKMTAGRVAAAQDPMLKILNSFSNNLFFADLVWDVGDSDKFNQLSNAKLIPFLNKITVSIRHSIPEFSAYKEQADKQFQRHARMHYGNWLIKDGSRKRPGPEEMQKLKRDSDDFVEQHQNSIAGYRKFFGTRVMAALALDKNDKNYAAGRKLLDMLKEMGKLEATVLDSKIKCSTIEQLIERRDEGDVRLHQQTIARLSRMLFKGLNEIEAVLGQFPPSMLSGGSNLAQNRINLKQVSGEQFEQAVIARAKELQDFFARYNTAISAQLAKIASNNEKRFKVRPVSVVKVNSVRSRAA